MGKFQSAMLIRSAQYADLPGISEIYNDATLNTTATYDYEPRTMEHRLAWFEEHAKSNYPVFVAQDEAGRIVGWSALNEFRPRSMRGILCSLRGTGLNYSERSTLYPTLGRPRKARP